MQSIPWLSQALILLALFALTYVVIRHQPTRNFLSICLGWGIWLTQKLSAVAAALFDLIMPINPRNGKLPTGRFRCWLAANAILVIVWLLSRQVEAPLLTDIVAFINAAFAVLNFTFLVGAYWALREGIDIMNGDLAYHRRIFNDYSTARNFELVCVTTILAVLQIAVVMQWAQQTRAIDTVAVGTSLGVPYIDFFVAVMKALPLVSLYVSTPGFSTNVDFVGGLDSWCFKAINAFGSLVIISTILGFIQQHVALRRMIESLLTRTDTTVGPLLRARFLRTPTAMKAYVADAFRSETDEQR